MTGELEHLLLPTNGITLHAAAAGPADAPLVILLHGFPEFWYGWRRQIGPLAAGLRVLAPDLRGYNLSEKPAGSAAYDIDMLCDDVLGLADAVGRRRFAVVGHDWGGALAWHLAARDPARIERAAVLNGPNLAVVPDYVLRHPFQLLKTWYVGFFQLPLVPEAALGFADFAALRSGMERSGRGDAFAAADWPRYREAWARPGALTAMLNWYRALPRRAMRRGGGAEGTAVPLRAIWGGRDAFLERGVLEAGLARCDRGEAFDLPSATHWVQHEEPDEVNRLLIEFLTA
jgi:epoxide hydrolase 4